MNPTLFIHALVRTSLEAGVLVLLVLAVQRVFRRQLPPRWACALWLLVVLRLLPISFGSSASIFNWLPRWFEPPVVVPLPVLQTSAAPASPSAAIFLHGKAPAAPASEPASSRPSATLDPSGLAAEPFDAIDLAVTEEHWTPGRILFALWLTGVVALGGYVTWTSLALARQFSRLRPIDDPGVLAVLRECCERLGVRRLPPISESAGVESPGLHGLFRPRLLLPVDFAARFSPDELRFVFLHELAHVQRLDLPLNWLVTSLQVIHWFNPLVWLGFARWRIDREIACDARAIAAAGPETNHAYGRTILRLLENITLPMSRPGLVGILETKRQLQRRMRMIAGYSDQTRPYAALALIATLGVVGLTDAQTDPAAAQPPPAAIGAVAGNPLALANEPRLIDGRDPLSSVSLRGERVLFLVCASGSMLAEKIDEVTSRAGQTDAEKRTAPKWQRTLQILRWMLAALSPAQQFQIVVFNEDATPLLPLRSNNAWIATQDTIAAGDVLARLNGIVPRDGANLERAFAFIGRLPAAQPADNIVLITDSLPTRNDSIPAQGTIDEASRTRFFEVATKQLPPRVPVQTILLPLDGDPAAPGRYWELANATRGSLVSPAKSWPEANQAAASPPGILTPIGLSTSPTHIAFIIDTSGSMRDPNRGGVWPDVIRKVGEILDAHPRLAGLQLLDGDGRFILGRPGDGAAAWLANTPALREQIAQILSRYGQDSISNPVPGIRAALRILQGAPDPEARTAFYLLGDEFIDVAAPAIAELDALNPADASGNRAITINAVGFPTTIRSRFSMGQTGVKFANLMRTVTYQHGGAFIALQDLEPSKPAGAAQVVRQPPQPPARTPPPPPQTAADFERVHQQELARIRATEAKARAQLDEDVSRLEPATAFSRRLAAVEEHIAAARFQLARTLFNQAMGERPLDLPVTDGLRKIQATLLQERTPVSFHVISDGQTHVAISGTRYIGQLAYEPLTLMPGNYEFVGRRKGCQDVIVPIQLRSGMQIPDVRVVCTTPLGP